VLALEFGRIIAERHAQMQGVEHDREPPPAVQIGPDAGIGDYQMRNAELAKLGYTRSRGAAAAPPPDPNILARDALINAGFPETDLAVAKTLVPHAKR
jgi:hypothetical protein